MSLQKLDIFNVRNIQSASLTPSSGLNFIYGDNASGKSSLLEAIFMLGRARSFRSSSIKQAIQFGQDHLIVSGLVESTESGISRLGLQLDQKNLHIRINQQSNRKRCDLAYALPVQLIHPTSYRVLDAGPQLRREFLDWGIFNANKEFLPIWRRYKKALSQRNALLKKKQTSQLLVWNQELVQYGKMLADYRQDYAEQLTPVFIRICQNFLSLNPIELHLLKGWDTAKTLDQVLLQDQEKDLRYGFTHSGPHRGDLHLLINGKLAKDFVSRGQLKLLVMALKLAQVHLLSTDFNHNGCILIDDIASELDEVNRAKLLNYLVNLNFQVFITATDLFGFGDISQINNYKVFHVEHGNVKQI